LVPFSKQPNCTINNKNRNNSSRRHEPPRGIRQGAMADLATRVAHGLLASLDMPILALRHPPFIFPYNCRVVCQSVRGDFAISDGEPGQRRGPRASVAGHSDALCVSCPILRRRITTASDALFASVGASVEKATDAAKIPCLPVVENSPKFLPDRARDQAVLRCRIGPLFACVDRPWCPL
jgi:hypothetical protein